MIKKLILQYKNALLCGSMLAMILLILLACQTFDARYHEKMADDFSFMTGCGAPSGHTVNVSAAISDDIVFRAGSPEQNKLAITCNVDWGEDILPSILDILDKYNIKITFFVTGQWAEKNPDLLRRMYMKGHEMQSHGYSHKLCSQIADEEILSELTRTSDAFHRILNTRPTIFAPPSGDFDERTVRLCKENGYRISLWSADTIDWREDSTSDVIYQRIMKKELPGAVLLMHPKEATAQVLPRLLDSFSEKKLQVVPLSELMAASEKK